MTDKKEKQTSCCETSSYSDSSLTPIKKEVTKEISSCCSSQNRVQLYSLLKRLPVVVIAPILRKNRK